MGLVLGFGPKTFSDQYRREAAQALRRSIEFNPDYAPARVMLAHIMREDDAPADEVARVVLPLALGDEHSQMKHQEIQVASLLVEGGYADAALSVLSPVDLVRRRQLNHQFDTWLIRILAHSMTGQNPEAAVASSVAEAMASGIGDEARERLEEVNAVLALPR